MATVALAGFVAKFYLSDDGGTNYYEIGELRDVEVNEEVDMFEATSHSSGGAKEYVPGNQGWEASIGALYISSDTAQDKLMAALNNKTKCKFRFDPEGTASGKERWAGDGYFRNWKLASPTNDLSAIAAEIQGTGLFVKSTQP